MKKENVTIRPLTQIEWLSILGILAGLLFVFFSVINFFGNWINAYALWPNLPVTTYLVITFIDTHITTIGVTLFLHRCQTHRSIGFHKALTYFYRFWLWLRTAMITKKWVAVHRKHHSDPDGPEDPHSPIFFGIWRVLFLGTKLYHKAASDQAILDQYGKGTPNDWIERCVYSQLSLLGPVVTLILNLWMFGRWGLGMWLVEMAWIPFFAAGIINGLGHWWGGRNFNTPDNSRNLPGNIWSFFTGGESLHNNHHHVQNSPNFAMKPGEIDFGYCAFCVFEYFNFVWRR